MDFYEHFWGAVYFFLSLLRCLSVACFQALMIVFTGMFMSFIVGCLSWYITKPKPQKAEVA
ncbi:hypothetical protein ACYY4Z_27225 (plasmid) [Escherichia coli]